MDFDDKTGLFDATKVTGLTPQPASPVAACLIVLAGTQAGRLFKLDRPSLTIGRAVDAGIRIEEEGISRYHARLQLTPSGEVEIEDLASTNGTFCNGDRIKRHLLHDGDKVQVGRTSILKFSYQDSLEEDFQRRQYEWATRDALTECYNKKYFLDRLPAEYVFAQRHKKMLGLAMIDIDFFKKINDQHGHPAGDHVLREVSQVLQAMTRRSDVLTRFGGEEFAILMREVDINASMVVCERIRRQVESHLIQHSGKSISVTVSVGLALFCDGMPATANLLLEQADGYLYAAKRGGRNRVCSVQRPT